jgi:hypothetical protein
VEVLSVEGAFMNYTHIVTLIKMPGGAKERKVTAHRAECICGQFKRGGSNWRALLGEASAHLNVRGVPAYLGSTLIVEIHP